MKKRVPLELVSPAISLAGSLIALFGAVTNDNRTKTGVLSAILGTIGSAVWLARAVDEYQQRELADAEAAAAAAPAAS